MLKNKITSLQISVIWVCWTTLNIFSHWISKPRIWNHKNHCKVSNGVERFSQSLCACKKSQYNVWYCKSGRHNRCQTFRCRNSQHQQTSINIPYNGLKVKGKIMAKLKLLLLVEGIECFVLLIFVKLLLFINLQEWNCLFYFLMNLIYVMITYWGLIRESILSDFSIKLIRISFC